MLHGHANRKGREIKSNFQTTRDIKQNNMRIGIAWSGGGAKGFAHLGILKALEELGITISEFSGTSAGAIAGSFYCYGYKPDQILEIIFYNQDISIFRINCFFDFCIRNNVCHQDFPFKKFSIWIGSSSISIGLAM